MVRGLGVETGRPGDSPAGASRSLTLLLKGPLRAPHARDCPRARWAGEGQGWAEKLFILPARRAVFARQRDLDPRGSVRRRIRCGRLIAKRSGSSQTHRSPPFGRILGNLGILEGGTCASRLGSCPGGAWGGLSRQERRDDRRSQPPRQSRASARAARCRNPHRA